MEAIRTVLNTPLLYSRYGRSVAYMMRRCNCRDIEMVRKIFNIVKGFGNVVQLIESTKFMEDNKIVEKYVYDRFENNEKE
ncbi:MAG: hypothetical protein AABY32_00825 [Nanoarchaeota archaeon]